MKKAKTMSISFLAASLIIGPCLAARAAGGRMESASGPKPPVLQTSVSTRPPQLPSPGDGVLLLNIKVPQGYHIFGGEQLSVKPGELPAGFKAGGTKYPKGKIEDDFEILRGQLTVEIPVSIPAGQGGQFKGEIVMDWQACQDFGDKVCFVPTTDKIPFEVKLGGPAVGTPELRTAAGTPGVAVPPNGEGVAADLPDLSGFREMGRFSGFKDPEEFLSWAGEVSGGKTEAGGLQDTFQKAAKENIPLALLLAFVFGILSSLTPCVYPVIPITVAYIGSRSEGQSRWRGFTLSLFFVLGLAVVYSVLGAVSAKAGAAFGSLTQTPWVGIPLALLFFALALSMFNLFEFKTPSSLTNRLEMTKQKGKGKGYTGALLIGALSGLVASPCIGPLILAILVVVASTGSVALGFIYLFAFALGMGVLFIVIGTFSGILASLPKSGSWMDLVRILFGSLILAASFYFASLYLPHRIFMIAGGLGLFAVILYLLFGEKKHFFPLPLRAVGIVLCAAGFAAVILLKSGGGTDEVPSEMAWESDIRNGLAASKSSGKNLLLDFRADWCVACVELEKKTWPQKDVQDFLGRTVAVKMDMTKNTEGNRALQGLFGVKGLPTVILLSPETGPGGGRPPAP